jgi:hypothetical protein
MSRLRFFLPALFVLSAFGQTPQNAVDPYRITKKAVQAILGANLGATNLGATSPGEIRPGMNYLAPLPVNVPRETSCSVPLIEMKIPKDVDFVMAQVAPPDGTRDNMPVVHGLPACPTGAGR